MAFVSEGTLFVAPFDLDKLDISGRSVAVLENVSFSPRTGSASYALSASGTLLYVPGGSRTPSLMPAWADRQGAVSLLPVPAGDYFKPALSPDGDRLSLNHLGDVWVFDLTRGSFSRVTFSEAGDWWPVWSPDGRHIVFGSNRSGRDQLYRKRADASGEAEELTKEIGHDMWPGSWSPDGETLVFTVKGERDDLWVLPLDDNDGPGSPRRFFETRFNDRDADFSPDGRWLAYMSDESGRWEVYVKPFPGGEAKWQVSTDGGWHPMWAGNGRELFYRNGDRMIVVDYSAHGSDFLPKPPRELFTVPTTGDVVRSTYDVTADGKRFMVLVPQETDEAPTRKLHVVLNWVEELERLVATD